MLLPAAPVRVRSRDSTYRYRPDSELFYLTGVSEPEAVALLRPGADHPFTLFVRERDEEAERWTGPRLGPEAAGERFGADACHSTAELPERLPALLRGAETVYLRPEADPLLDRIAMGEIERARLRGGRQSGGPRGLIDPGVVLDEMRLRKDDAEIARIRTAATVTAEAFHEVLPSVVVGMGEWEVEARIEAAFRSRRASGPAFSTIAASGAHATVLHYEENDDTLVDGSLLLVDAGAEVEMYCGDVTRTIPVAGSFRPEQRTLYRIVEEAHAAALQRVAPGESVGALHRAAVERLAEGLIDVGLLEGPLDAAIEGRSYRRFFPHQTSHWLGLDVHDVGRYRVGDEERVLEPGMVLTVEPGLYIPEDAEDAGTFRGIGIRLEDDLLVTESGAENLTASLPLGIDDVEEWLSQ